LSDKRLSRGQAALAAAALGLVSSLGVQSAMANESDAEPAVPLKYSVTPFVGYRFGGKFGIADTNGHVEALDHVSYGVALDLATDEQTRYELFYSRQSTSLGAPSPTPSATVIEYLHLGGTVNVVESQRFQPYVIGTLGVTRFSPDSPIGRDRLYFSLSLGGGLRIPFNEHLALRLEARGFATFFNTNTAVFCRSDQAGGVCQIHGSGSSFLQGDALAGLSYTF
jgi:Outer membrane protein beta-barrel domain